MVISEQEGSGEFISIKKIWLKQIDRINEVSSNWMLKGDRADQSVGIHAFNSAVDTLAASIVDYGDAPLRSEYLEWLAKESDWMKEHNTISRARHKYKAIIYILNKYQMLHDSLPRGYSNVKMESVSEVVKDE